MRHLAAIAAFALLLAVPLWAQHGGGGHSGGGGHAGGFSGGHAGGFSSGHVSGGGSVSRGTHSGAGSARGFNRPSFAPRGFSNRGFSNRGFSSRGPFLHDGFRGYRFRTYGFRNNCYGYGCAYYGYPWAYGGYYDPYFYDPYWYSDSGSSDDADYDQNVADAAEMNRQNLEEQRMLRQEEADGDQDAYAPAARAPRAVRPGSAAQPQGAAIMPNTVLVFRDQHKEEISNYAIVGQTVYNFTPQRTERIPLTQLDLAATTKANQDAGVTFRLPATSDAP